MRKNRTSNEEPRTSYGCNEDIVILYELDFNGHTIKPGSLIKFKNEKATYTFKNLAHNIKKDIQWIDCMDHSTGICRSFYITQLKGIVLPKKSRRKKVGV